MKKTILKIILGTTAVLFFSLFALPQAAEAKTYPVGSLVKYEKSSTVYYIASDGYGYPFPDEATYKSWYTDFSKVESLSWKNLRYIKVKATPITVYPTSPFVKFEGSNKVYAVRPGAELRWIKTEGIARQLGGENWNKKIITLSTKNVTQYTIGTPIENADEIDNKHEVRNTLAIDKELKRRNVITLAQVKKKTQTSYGAQLKYIKENLKDNLNPRFNRDENSYELVARYDEEEIKLIAAAYDADAKITINDLPVPQGSAITFKLSKPGTAQTFYIKSNLSNGQEETYKVRIRHEWPDTENDLSSLTENLRDSFKFNPDVRFYRIEANENEKKIRIRAKAKSTNAKIKINGTEIKNGGSYTQELDSVETIIEIDVTAQNGKQKTYTITVEKER